MLQNILNENDSKLAVTYVKDNFHDSELSRLIVEQPPHSPTAPLCSKKTNVENLLEKQNQDEELGKPNSFLDHHPNCLYVTLTTASQA